MATEEATRIYRGNCHCGAFVYEAQLPEIKVGTTCNCSMCFKKGTRIVYTPVKNVKVVKGSESDLTKYQFNNKVINHMVCFRTRMERDDSGRPKHVSGRATVEIRVG